MARSRSSFRYGSKHEAMEVVRSQQASPSGTLRINAFPTAAREIFTWLVLPFLRVYSEVHIDIVTEGRLVHIVAGGFDLGVRSSDLVPADMIAPPLGGARRNVVMGTPSYLKAHKTPLIPQDLAEHSRLRVRLPMVQSTAGRSRRTGPITLDEASLARTAARASVGLTLAMESDVRDDIEAGRLVPVLEGWTPILSPLSLYYPSRRNPTAAFKAFVDFARRQSGASITPTPPKGPKASIGDIATSTPHPTAQKIGVGQ